MAKKIKLTPHQKEALEKLYRHNGLMVRWDDLKAPGPTLAKLHDMQMIERGRVGSVSAWTITVIGRAALGYQ